MSILWSWSSDQAVAVAEGLPFTPQGCWHRGFCLSRGSPAARDAGWLLGTEQPQVLPDPAQMEEAARVASVVATGMLVRAVSGTGSRDAGQEEALWRSHSHPAILQCEPGSSLVPQSSSCCVTCGDGREAAGGDGSMLDISSACLSSVLGMAKCFGVAFQVIVSK